MGKQEEVRTAGERLERIEAWGRRACYAAVASSCMLVVIACAVAYVGVEYLRLKGAVQEASAKIQAAALDRRPLTTAAGNPGMRIGRSAP